MRLIGQLVVRWNVYDYCEAKTYLSEIVLYNKPPTIATTTIIVIYHDWFMIIYNISIDTEISRKSKT